MSSELINEFIAGATTERKDQIISDLAKGLEQKKYTLGEIVEKISVFMASDQEITVSRAIILISETIGQAKQIHYNPQVVLTLVEFFLGNVEDITCINESINAVFYLIRDHAQEFPQQAMSRIFDRFCNIEHDALTNHTRRTCISIYELLYIKFRRIMPKMPDIDKQNMMKSIAIVSYGEKDTNSLLTLFTLASHFDDSFLSTDETALTAYFDLLSAYYPVLSAPNGDLFALQNALREALCVSSVLCKRVCDLAIDKLGSLMSIVKVECLQTLRCLVRLHGIEGVKTTLPTLWSTISEQVLSVCGGDRDVVRTAGDFLADLAALTEFSERCDVPEGQDGTTDETALAHEPNTAECAALQQGNECEDAPKRSGAPAPPSVDSPWAVAVRGAVGALRSDDDVERVAAAALLEAFAVWGKGAKELVLAYDALVNKQKEKEGAESKNETTSRDSEKETIKEDGSAQRDATAEKGQVNEQAETKESDAIDSEQAQYIEPSWVKEQPSALPLPPLPFLSLATALVTAWCEKLKENKKTLKNEIDIAPYIPALEVMLERGILGDKLHGSAAAAGICELSTLPSGNVQSRFTLSRLGELHVFDFPSSLSPLKPMGREIAKLNIDSKAYYASLPLLADTKSIKEMAMSIVEKAKTSKNALFGLSEFCQKTISNETGEIWGEIIQKLIETSKSNPQMNLLIARNAFRILSPYLSMETTNKIFKLLLESNKAQLCGDFALSLSNGEPLSNIVKETIKTKKSPDNFVSFCIVLAKMQKIEEYVELVESLDEKTTPPLLLSSVVIALAVNDTISQHLLTIINGDKRAFSRLVAVLTVSAECNGDAKNQNGAEGKSEKKAKRRKEDNSTDDVKKERAIEAISMCNRGLITPDEAALLSLSVSAQTAHRMFALAYEDLKDKENGKEKIAELLPAAEPVCDNINTIKSFY